MPETKIKEVKNTQRLHICFGSQKLFNAQHNLAENGYKTRQEWSKGRATPPGNCDLVFVGLLKTRCKTTSDSLGAHSLCWSAFRKRAGVVAGSHRF
ncbi:hypothetical protein [Okeania sp. KiyG1]|uniref:hypothetical protein n=1 Tax=Okeania sp. KiyG1 TaxID=2720165 RepID=UPI001921F6F5|nr:hypothetical protein [Okeania sp. KiyG1]